MRTHFMRTPRHLVLVTALTLLLSACGGGGDNPLDVFEGDAGAAGTDGKSTLMAVSAEAPGGHCATGGSKIDAGMDANANGLLDANEVSSTQYVCSGASGAGAASTLVQMLDEPSGANCAAGGKTINVGLDGNANGVLDAGEVSSSAYVCNGSGGSNGTSGTNGTNGANGANGISTLISIAKELAGVNCVYGGNKISSGADTNANSALDASEVSATTYSCNGAPSASLSWVNVTATTEQAKANISYVANSDAQVVITLPADADIAIGDVVRINGAGAGGWKIAQKAGQAVYTKNLGGMGGLNWTGHDPSGPSWTSVASSADGSRLVAVAISGEVYTSIDSGATWQRSSGTKAAPTEFWYSVASSADGSKLVAVAGGGVDAGPIYTSGNSGATWEPSSGPKAAPIATWYSVASSADGSKLVAVALGGKIYTSGDSGATWQPSSGAKAAPSAGWTSVASSADGTKLVAVSIDGEVYNSSDSGATWEPSSGLEAAPAANWVSVASSADGSKLVAAATGGTIYTSSDRGANWEPSSGSSGAAWRSVASSADGSKLVAVVTGGQIYTSTATTTLGPDGSISGGASDAIELQYVGNGMFNVSSHEGTLTIE